MFILQFYYSSATELMAAKQLVKCGKKRSTGNRSTLGTTATKIRFLWRWLGDISTIFCCVWLLLCSGLGKIEIFVDENGEHRYARLSQLMTSAAGRCVFKYAQHIQVAIHRH